MVKQPSSEKCLSYNVFVLLLVLIKLKLTI